jgi:hypothetical protein
MGEDLFSKVVNDLQNSPREDLTNEETRGEAVFRWRLEICVQMGLARGGEWPVWGGNGRRLSNRRVGGLVFLERLRKN